MYLRIALLLATVGVSAVALTAPAASAPEEPRQLVFVRGEGLAAELYVVREDGKGARRLTRNRVADYAPVWSPDGKKILFGSYRDGDDELFVMDADGTDVRRLTRNTASDLTARWSPDGRFIAFTSDRGRRGEHELHVMRADGTGVRRLLRTVNHPDHEDFQFSPTWSPDGRRILFTMTVADGNPELFVVGLDGKGLKRLTFTRGSTEELGDDTMPHWSESGRIVFVSNREGQSDVWTMRPDGTGQRPVARRAKTDDWNPRLSPDGRRIAYTRHVIGGGPVSVWTMNANGTGARRLVAGYEPDWRP
jgi:Tol biopolymer transport system component